MVLARQAVGTAAGEREIDSEEDMAHLLLFKRCKRKTNTKYECKIKTKTIQKYKHAERQKYKIHNHTKTRIQDFLLKIRMMMIFNPNSFPTFLGFQSSKIEV